jgi:hypothetical protein
MTNDLLKKEKEKKSIRHLLKNSPGNLFLLQREEKTVEGKLPGMSFERPAGGAG